MRRRLWLKHCIRRWSCACRLFTSADELLRHRWCSGGKTGDAWTAIGVSWRAAAQAAASPPLHSVPQAHHFPAHVGAQGIGPQPPPMHYNCCAPMSASPAGDAHHSPPNQPRSCESLYRGVGRHPNNPPHCATPLPIPLPHGHPVPGPGGIGAVGMTPASAQPAQRPRMAPYGRSPGERPIKVRTPEEIASGEGAQHSVRAAQDAAKAHGFAVGPLTGNDDESYWKPSRR